MTTGEITAGQTADVRTAVYRLYDKQGTLLYVGMSSNPETRCAHHACDKAWWPDVADRKEVWFDTRVDAGVAERDAIQRENPVHNKERYPLDFKPATPTGKYTSVWLPDDLYQERKASELSYAECIRRGLAAGEPEELDAKIRRIVRDEMAVVAEQVAALRKLIERVAGESHA
jgi:predicted GIY-YIG superfamily endonuclease